MFGSPTVLSGRLVILAVILVNLVATPGGSANDFATDRLGNWHQWRGPNGDGVAPQGQPPLSWDAEKNVQWRFEIPGRGSSTPIVWGDRVFVLTAIDTGKDGGVAPQAEAEVAANPFKIRRPNTLYRYVVYCLDRNTGRVRWERTAAEALPHEGHHHDNSFASSSPTTDGRFLYAWFGSRGVYCYDLDGELQWHVPLENVQTRLNFGEACSPVLHGDRLILNRDNETKSEILVVDARSGKLVWRAERDEISAWATPLVTEHAGRTQVITNASKRVRSYDLATGEVVWECAGQVSNVTPSPVRFENTAICMSGYRGSAALAIPLDSAGDVSDAPTLAWRFGRDTPYVPSPLLYDDRLYFTKSNSAILTCLDARSGAPVYEARRLPDLMNVYASPVGAAGRVYLVSREGTTLVLRHGPTFEILATNKLDDSIDASPAIAGSQLFLRGRKYLYCLRAA